MPCIKTVLATQQSLATAGTVATGAQPFTITWVGDRTGSTTTEQGILQIGGNVNTEVQVGFAGFANNAFIGLNSGGATVFGLSDNTIHSLQIIYNSGSGKSCADGTCTTRATGTSTATNNITLFEKTASTEFMTGTMFTLSVYPLGYDRNTNYQS